MSEISDAELREVGPFLKSAHICQKFVLYQMGSNTTLPWQQNPIK